MKLVTLLENTACSQAFRANFGLSLYFETPKHRILFDAGPNGDFAANAEALISTAHLLMTKRVNLAMRIVPGGTHSEASWEKQIPIFMDCLGL